MAIQYWNEYDKANCFNFNIYILSQRYYDLNTAVKLSHRDYIEMLALKNG